MAITIQKALDRAFLIKQLEAYESVMLWTQADRKAIDIPAHYNIAVSGLTVVADGTLTSTVELAEITYTFGGYVPSVGTTVDTVACYAAGTQLTVVADGTLVDPLTEVEETTANGALADGESTVVVGDTVDSVVAYTTGTTLTVQADGYRDTVIEESMVTPVPAGTIISIGDTVEWVDATYKDVKINVHKYDKLEDFELGRKYFIGQCTVYDDCLYQAIEDVDGTDASFPEDKFKMVGAASIIKIVEDALPLPTDVKEDSVFWLKADELDGAGEVKNPKGIYTFDKATGTYEMYREYEVEQIEHKSFFEDVAPADLGYTGDEDKVVSSKYLHTTLKNVTAVIQEEIDDVVEAIDNVHYEILDDRAALDAVDLDELPDNSLTVFLVKKDDTKIEETVIVDKEVSADVYEDLTGNRISAREYGIKVAVYALDSAAGTGYIAVDPATEYSVVDSEMVKVYDYEEIAAPGTMITESAYDTLVAQYEYDVLDGATPTDPTTLYTAIAQTEPKTVDVYPHAIPGTDPIEFESSLYGCVAFDDDQYPIQEERKLEYIGKIANGVSALDETILDYIKKALFNSVEIGEDIYKKDDGTDPDALLVVEDKTQVVESNEIKISDVVLPYGEIVEVGNFVVKVSATENTVTNRATYVKRNEVDVPVLQYVHDEVVEYVDDEDPTIKQHETYLTYQGTQVMPRIWEDKDIDFTDEDDYKPIVEGDTI